MSTTYCKTAWIIDDEEMSIFCTENILRTNKFSSEIRCFTNARKALAELEILVESNAFPDFILLDLNMPVLDGWGFLHAYRQFPEEIKEKCSIYILSSSVDENDINRSKMHSEVCNFLTKPLYQADLETLKVQTSKGPFTIQ